MFLQKITDSDVSSVSSVSDTFKLRRLTGTRVTRVTRVSGVTDVATVAGEPENIPQGDSLSSQEFTDPGVSGVSLKYFSMLD